MSAVLAVQKSFSSSLHKAGILTVKSNTSALTDAIRLAQTGGKILAVAQQAASW
jgi:hypothetical protein